MKKDRSVFLVPASGTRMKDLRIPLWAVITLVLAAVAGIAGFFVPLDRLILTEQELAQKKDLEEQNDRLHNNIGATLRMLSALKERTARLEATRDQYRDLVGLPQKPPPAPARKPPGAGLSPAAVSRQISETEKLVARFASLVGEEGRSLFDTIPVCRPVSPSRSIVSKQFGMDRDPFTGKAKMHFGIDFAAESGVPVVACAAGTVTRVENDPVWGRRVTIAHGRGFKTVYAHLGTVSAAQGRSVKRGEAIGTVGMSGLTTGPHVHYEILHKDKQVNPEEYFFPEWVVAEN